MIFIIIILSISAIFLAKNTMPYVKSKFFSPLFIHSSLLVVTLIISVVYYYWVEDKVYIYRLEDISEDVFLRPIIYYLLAINSTFIGFIIYFNFQNKSGKEIFKTKIEIENFKFRNLESTNVSPIIPFSLLFTSIVLLFIIYGNDVWARDYYLVEGQVITRSILKFVEFAFVITNALIYRKTPFVANSQMFFFILIHISTGSRKIFVLYILFILLSFLLNDKNKRKVSGLFFKIVLALLLLSYVITLRRLPSHGLFAYLAAFDDAIADIGDNLKISIYYVTSFSYFVTANVLEVYQSVFSWYYMKVSLNPMFGRFAGWYEISPLLALYRNAPYNSYGEVFSAGYFFTFIFYTIIGFLYGFFEKHIKKFYSNNNIAMALIIFIFILFSILFAQQYNLRSMMRFIYYALLIIATIYGFKKVFGKKKSKRIDNL